MSIASQLELLQQTKSAIKTAIQNKGVPVGDEDSFASYADRIGEIEGGGSGYQLKDLPTGSISTVSDAEPLPLNALKVSVEAWQEGSGDPSPSNVRPIHGWSSGEISVVGKNWAKQVIQGYIRSGTISIDNDAEIVLFFARQGVKYTASSQSTFNRNTLAQVDTDNVTHGTPVYNITNYSGYTWEATWTGWTVWYVKASRDAVIEQTVQVEVGSTATTYEPYQSNQFTQQFPQTIYGAEWDVLDGELKVTDGYIASYNGETLPSTWISDRDVYASGTTPTTGAEVVYKLATPTTIPQQAESIRLLEGVNNLYADCGEVLEGEYFSGSAKGYVDGIKYANEGDGGIASYTNIKSADELTGATAVTFEVYARIDSYVNKTSGAYARLIEFGNSQQTGRLGFIGLASDNDNNICYWDDTADVASGIDTWTLGDTHLISVVKTTSGSLKIYIDGVLKYTGSSTLTITTSIIDYVAERGGYSSQVDSARQLNGEVYTWRVYAKELSAANIAQNLAADRSLYSR